MYLKLGFKNCLKLVYVVWLPSHRLNFTRIICYCGEYWKKFHFVILSKTKPQNEVLSAEGKVTGKVGFV